MNYSSEIKKCVQALKDGKVILYPTDTIWGIGCDATNEEAVKMLKKYFWVFQKHILKKY